MEAYQRSSLLDFESMELPKGTSSPNGSGYFDDVIPNNVYMEQSQETESQQEKHNSFSPFNIQSEIKSRIISAESIQSMPSFKAPIPSSDFPFAYNKHNESTFDDEDLFPALNADSPIVKFDDVNLDLINHATLKALIVQLTSPEVIDYNLICDFFLTYRTFVSSVEVMGLLLTRLIWALQYINSNDSERTKIGKLVLLRTFVVLRHWILNYFVDDFEPNSSICDMFTKQLNEITEKSNFLANEDQKLFERKIVSDLKIHWIRQVNEFWNSNIDIDTSQLESVISYHLPSIVELNLSTNKLIKSSTNMSIHTNPSYRRSAMLSLYDQKAHHKCLILDESSTDENPQMLVNNLLLSHKSSRSSINNQLQVLHQKCKKENNFKPHINPNVKHNYIYLQDSSVTLKRTVKNDIESSQFTVKPNSPNSPTQSEPGSTVFDSIDGFSTNGNLKIPSSKVFTIIPPTPVKKMEYTLKNEFPDTSSIQAPLSPHGDVEYDISRKNSIKKLFYGWKKTFNQPEGNPTTNLDTNASQKDSNTIARKSLVQISEHECDNLDNRVDVLSARIIDELEHLIRFYIINEQPHNTILEDNYDEFDNEKYNKDYAQQIQENNHSNTVYAFKEGDGGEMNNNNLTNNTNNVNNNTHNNNISKNHSYNTNTTTTTNTNNNDKKNNNNINNNNNNDNNNNNYNHNNRNNNNRGSVKETNDDEDLPEHNIDIGDLSDLNIIKIDKFINEGSLDEDIFNSEDQEHEHEQEQEEEEQQQQQEEEEEEEDVSKESSFQKPVSINWNDETNLELENSHPRTYNSSFESNKDEDFNFEVIDLNANNYNVFKSPRKSAMRNSKGTFSKNLNLSQESSLNGAGHRNVDVSPTKNRNSNYIPKSKTQYFDVSSDFVEDNVILFSGGNNLNQSYSSSISTPSNLTEYDADVAELGILNNPHDQMFQQSHSKRISFNEANINYNQKRLSVISRTSSSSMFKRDSAKSYISYDSLFSSSNGSTGKINNNMIRSMTDNNGFLKKKTAFSNLRDNNTNLHNSMGSLFKGSAVVHKGIRLSTLSALTELPFNCFEDSFSENTVNTSGTQKKVSMKSNKSSEVYDSSIFSVAIKTKKSSKKTSNTSSNNSAAIPGINNCILKELAAIPDESFNFNNPVDTALEKLEGKASKHSLDDTQEILDEINNAQTLDVIDLDDMSNEISEEKPLYHQNTNDNTNETKKSRCFTSTDDNEKENIDLLDFAEQTQSSEMSNFGIGNAPKSQLHKSKSSIFIPNSISNTNFSVNSNAPNKMNQTKKYQSPKAILEEYSVSSELLSVEKVLQTNYHISFVLSYDSKALAHHFTMIEQDILQEIDWKELIELKWNKDLQPVNSWLEVIVNDSYFSQNKGVNLVISRFNLMVNWIISEILLTKTMTERINLISRFIHVAQNCYALQNFATLMQIILGLTSEKVGKLKETWKNLPPGDILMLKNLEELGSPFKNFLNIRLCINQMVPSKGCIPFVGLYLSDLIFNAERPAFIKANGFNDDSLPELDENEKFINFSRFRTSVHIVKSLSQCIEWSKNYDLPIDSELLSKCLYVRSLDEDEMNYCINVLGERTDLPNERVVSVNQHL